MNKALRSLVLLVTIAMVVPALGQPIPYSADSPPDKSEYSLFNPTPDDQMRPFCTDRPTKSNLPCTVDAGHFQLGSDLFNWSYAHFDGVTANTYLYTNPTLKLGLTNTIDAEANIAPAERVTTKGPLGKQELTGIGDLILRSKINVVGPEGADFQATLLPYVTFPTAKPGIGDKAVEGGLIVPLSFTLPQDFTLVSDPEIDVLRNQLNGGRHTNFANVVNLSHSLRDNLTGYVELWGEITDDPSGTIKEASLDLALAWLVPKVKDLELVLGANIGLTAATPRVQAYLGISHRF